MSVAIALKIPEGLVLASDSRVVVQGDLHGHLVETSFDGARKLISLSPYQPALGLLSFGQPALGLRPPQSFATELARHVGPERLPAADLAGAVAEFFAERWRAWAPSGYDGQDMGFFLGAFDEASPYGRLFRFAVPSRPAPEELLVGDTTFGLTWNGDGEYVDRLIHGRSPTLMPHLAKKMGLGADDLEDLTTSLLPLTEATIPYEAIPLDEAVALAAFLVEATVQMQRFTWNPTTSGGSAQVAVITTEGFRMRR